MKRYVAFAVLLVLYVCTSCGYRMRNNQLQAVAKDWSYVIRASQVIPVYPLTEDLQPGDVLLVSTPIEQQVEIYEKDGFLPLDQHLVRLYAADVFDKYDNVHMWDFRDFYNSRYETASKVPPTFWQTFDADSVSNWRTAPKAAFPSYSFKVKEGKGLNLAIPIEGVPFAMGLMNASSATGSVTIADAHTYGLDNVRLENIVREWAGDHRDILMHYRPMNGNSHYLRVVSRVYVTGRVNVSVNNDDSKGAMATAGEDRPVDLMMIKEDSTKENYSNVIKSLSSLATSQLPGAKIKVATASSRSVTMTESFVRPLVIGYVGFDMQILTGGVLGPPISTRAQLSREKQLETGSGVSLHRTAALVHTYQALSDIQGSDAQQIAANLDELDRLLPEVYPFTTYDSLPLDEHTDRPDFVAGDNITDEGFLAITDYLGYADRSIEVVGAYLQSATLEADERATLESQLGAAQRAREEMAKSLSRQPALAEAIEFVFFGN